MASFLGALLDACRRSILSPELVGSCQDGPSSLRLPKRGSLRASLPFAARVRRDGWNRSVENKGNRSSCESSDALRLATKAYESEMDVDVQMCILVCNG